MNKKMLGVLLIGGAAVGVYVARRQIQDAILNLRDRAVELVLLGLDDPSEDRGDHVQEVEEAEAQLRARTGGPRGWGRELGEGEVN